MDDRERCSSKRSDRGMRDDPFARTMEEKKREKSQSENQLSVVSDRLSITKKQKTFKDFEDEPWKLLTVEWLSRWGFG
jgi:hypothetical protein